VDRPYPVVALVVLALLTGSALLVAGSVSGTAFSTYNPAWDGTSELRSEARTIGTEVAVVRNTSEYRSLEGSGTVVFVLAPEEAYAAEEAAAVREFAAAGGTVVVTGDFGPATDRLLAEMGVTARLEGGPVRDEDQYTHGPAFPLATNVTAHPYTRGVDRLALNHGTTLRLESATQLVGTSSFAYLDSNRNEQLDGAETLRASPVVAVEPVGDGQVVVASDPDLFINAMLDEADNRQFARNVLGAHDRAAIDVSHAGGLPPVAWVVIAIRGSPVAQVVGGLGVVLAVVGRHRLAGGVRTVADRLGPDRADPPAASHDELVASLREQYPDWDEARLRRVTQTLIESEEKVRTDE